MCPRCGGKIQETPFTFRLSKNYAKGVMNCGISSSGTERILLIKSASSGGPVITLRWVSRLSTCLIFGVPQHRRLKNMQTFTKDDLIEKLLEIKARGWIPNARHGNAGGVGNTLEDLLGIQENNLPIPNAAEWELKCQRKGSSSLTTLFHMEPSPRAVRFVSS